MMGSHMVAVFGASILVLSLVFFIAARPSISNAKGSMIAAVIGFLLLLLGGFFG